MAVVTDTETRVKYADDGKVKICQESAFTNLNEELDKKGEAQIEALAVQTFAIHSVSDESPVEDLAQLISDASQQAAVINRGLTLYQQQFANRAMSAKDFTPVEGTYDLVQALEAIGTRKAAPRKDIRELLGDMDPDRIAAELAALPKDKLEAIFARM